VATRIAVLTPRQRQIIRLLATGLSDSEIAERLGIAPRTVRAHCDALRVKLGVEKRRQLLFAYREITGNDPFAASDLE
jgi:DNA-binding CsgD family transcriptional regulator